MKRSIAFLLAWLLLLPATFFACNKKNTVFDVTLADAATCRIVYASGEKTSAWRQYANELARTIRDITGKVLAVVPDSEPESEELAEILVGETTRALSKEETAALGDAALAFSFRISGRQFAVCASNETSMKMAVSFFAQNYQSVLQGTLAGNALSFPSALSVRKTVNLPASAPSDALAETTFLQFYEGGKTGTSGVDAFVTPTACAARNGSFYAMFADGNGGAILCRYDEGQGAPSAKSAPLAVGNAASMCYDPIADRFVVLHNINSKEITMIDPESLCAVSSATAFEPLDAIAYDINELCYLAKLAGKEELVRLDARFKSAMVRRSRSQKVRFLIIPTWRSVRSALIKALLTCSIPQRRGTRP